MKASDFRKKRLLDRFGIVETQGTKLGQRRYRGFSVELYSLEDFYVEVWKKVGLGIIHWIETVDKKNLEYYTNDLDINELKN